MKIFLRHGQRLGSRASRRRNRRTATTLTPLRRAILMSSRSRLRSSSRVTRYCALPLIAASKISSSSGSRQTFSARGVSTTVARMANSRTNISASRKGYLNLRTNRGRVRTSASSPSCDSDVTAVNLARLQALTTCHGGPAGLRKAETQTFVSSRATNGTAFCFGLGAGSADFGLDFVLPYRPGARSHFTQQAVKLATPLRLRAQSNRHLRFFLNTQRPKRPQHAVFEDRLEGFYFRNFSLRQRHGIKYNDNPTLGSIPIEKAK